MGTSTQNYPFSAGQGYKSVVAKTTNYLVAASDNGVLFTFNGSSLTATLPATATPAPWFVTFINLNASTLIINPNGLTLNGSASSITLGQNNSATVWADGSNYEYAAGATPPVSSVFGRTGTVVATSGDYSVGQVTGAEATANKDAASGYAGLDANTRLNLAEQATGVDARTTTSESISDSDRAKLVTFSNTSAVAAAIAAPGASFVAGWYADIVNLNTGIITLTPTSSTINGQATLVLARYEGGRLVSDGANYIFLTGQPTLDTPSDADVLTFETATKRWRSKGIGTIGGANASQIRGNNVSSATPTDQQVLRWSTTDNQYDLVFADGIYHGDLIFGVDSSIQKWFDDFVWGNLPASTLVDGTSRLGELGWDYVLGSGTTPLRCQIGIPPHVGAATLLTGTSASTYSALFWRGGSGITGGGGGGHLKNAGGMPLFDYPAWKMVWVFGFPSQRQTTAATPFPLAKKQFYCGLAVQDGNPSAGGIPTWTPSGTINARPPFFVGLRFDTDPGAGALALTSVANASGGKTIYTGAALTLVASQWIGTTFVITGFTNSANNGTFLCTANTTTTLTLVNASGVAETHAATATGPACSDSTFKFETVSNPNTNQRRNDTQGTVVDTSITPTENAWYRLELLYTSSANLVMTLSGNGTTFTHTFSSVPVTTCKGTVTTHRGNGLGDLQPGTNVTDGTSSNHCWAAGSLVTMSGMGQTFYNGTFSFISQDLNDSYSYVLAGAADSTVDSTPTITGHPGVVPYFAWGNDTQTSPVTAPVSLDLFAMVWDTSLAAAPQTLDTTRARYVPGT
jgi:hypothetical protein